MRMQALVLALSTEITIVWGLVGVTNLNTPGALCLLLMMPHGAIALWTLLNLLNRMKEIDER